ncbi:hypothetical protein DSCA_07310 [Desulfosarcina alkanivorans]|uniref:Uncharacterized protein n=1 Tax=Desulfosarcina alkanivorans TaxID=571177 RepID=A0A5K7YJ86_9BACT|nr:hypothetical protein DSCA_07310 [Desulfosarcina alkanivorans]
MLKVIGSQPVNGAPGAICENRPTWIAWSSAPPAIPAARTIVIHRSHRFNALSSIIFLVNDVPAGFAMGCVIFPGRVVQSIR